jgi:hypothetical protein
LYPTEKELDDKEDRMLEVIKEEEDGELNSGEPRNDDTKAMDDQHQATEELEDSARGGERDTTRAPEGQKRVSSSDARQHSRVTSPGKGSARRLHDVSTDSKTQGFYSYTFPTY